MCPFQGDFKRKHGTLEEDMKARNDNKNGKKKNIAEAVKALLQMHRTDPHLIISHDVVFTDSFGDQACLQTPGFSPFELIARK